MSTPTPALDFCRKVAIWQDADGTSAGLPVIMPDREQGSLNTILADADHGLNLPYVEDRARRWLIGYRELVSQQGGLTPAQLAELNHVVDNQIGTTPRERQRASRQRTRRSLKPWQWITIGAAGLLIGLGTAGLVHALAATGNGGPPPAGPVAAAPQHPAPGALTDLQQFRADWNVPPSASPSAGGINAQNLVLLQDGLYYPSPWDILPGDAGWTAGNSGTLTASAHDGGYADVTDSDGTTYTVPVGEPFAVASNPQLVFRVLHDSTIQSMPQPHAIRVRYRV